jgi:hypothetical protein
MDRPGRFIERYRGWAYAMRDAFRALSPDDDYRYWFDPFWVRAEPYRVAIAPGQSTVVKVWVRNFRPASQRHRIVLHAPPGIRVEPAVIEGALEGESRLAFPVKVTATVAAAPGASLVGLDVTLDGHRYGEWFDFVLGISAGPAR